MNHFRVLVADDDPNLNRNRYEKLLDLEDALDFKWDLIGKREEFERAHFEEFDAVLLDVNLTHWNDMPLAEAVQCIKGRAPIVLASQYWGDDAKTTTRIQEVLAQSKEAHFVQILILNDLAEAGSEARIKGIRQQLRLAIARHRRYGVLQLADDEALHILHLSDPQYGDPDTDGWASMTEDEIADFVDKIQPDIHFIAITGDITYQGHSDEFAVASERLETLLGEFLPNRGDWRERILLVPGNHDVNLRLAAADLVDYDFESLKPTVKDTSAKRKDHIRYALQPFRDFAWNLTGDPNWKDAIDLCWINDSFRHLGVRFYLLNSAGAVTCGNPSVAELPQSTLKELARGRSRSDKVFSIAFCHHGPPESQNLESNDSEIVSISNWPEVAKFLQTTKTRIFVHGHGHKRDVRRQDWQLSAGEDRKGILSKNEFLRVMAPTTHLGKNLRTDGGRRGFNLISLGRSRGYVESVEIDSYDLNPGSAPTRSGREEFRL